VLVAPISGQKAFKDRIYRRMQTSRNPTLFRAFRGWRMTDLTGDMAAGLTHPALIVLEAGSMAEIDFTGAQILADVIAQCRRRKIDFAIARLESVRGQQALARFGILALLGPDHLFRSVQEAINALAPAP
jgi:MFS superfamily sulfate permease-like transporter